MVGWGEAYSDGQIWLSTAHLIAASIRFHTADPSTSPASGTLTARSTATGSGASPGPRVRAEAVMNMSGLEVTGGPQPLEYRCETNMIC